MSMLAEKKNRTKWCLNPMGNDWAKDENKFGLKMLQKMGWEPGTGLGAHGQGVKDFVKFKFKSDTKGLGCSQKNSSNNWTKNVEGFNQLLAQLNGDPETTKTESITLESLEKKSKSSKARVHYHKFTRGKDVSQYSSKDLNCILPSSEINGEIEDEGEQAANNMYTYFNTKVKNPYKTSEPIETSPETELVEDSLDCEESNESKTSNMKRKEVDSLEIEEFQLTAKKKKSKKFKENIELNKYDNCNIETNDSIVENTEDAAMDLNGFSNIFNHNSNLRDKKVKKKKSKHKDRNFKESNELDHYVNPPDSIVVAENISTSLENVDDSNVPKKNKKKKSDCIVNINPAETHDNLSDTISRNGNFMNFSTTENISENIENSNGVAHVKEKKRKNKLNIVDHTTQLETSDCSSKLFVENIPDILENDETSHYIKKKKKKSKDRNNLGK